MTETTMTLADAVTYHQLSLTAEARSPQTLRLYLLYERKFLEYLETQHIAPTLDAFNSVNVRAALEWFRGRSSNGKRGGQTSEAAFVNTLKILGNFMAAEEIYVDSPLRKLRRVRVPKVMRQVFTQAELVALWGACRLSRTPIRDEALFLTLLDTGMRIGEAVTLTLDKVQLDQHQVVVGLAGKSRSERVVPIGDPTKRDGGRAIRALRTYLDERPESARSARRLFLGLGGYPLSGASASDVIKRLGAAAGVENCIPHRLRHTMATHYLTTHPGDELGLRRIIGHTSREVTAAYIHLSQSTLAQRAGQASLAETLGARPDPAQEAARRKEPIVKAWSGTVATVPAPVPRRLAHVEREAIIDAVRNDPELRQALLRALLGGTQQTA